MASGALFGNSSGRSQSKNLLEFRAGKMHLRSRMVHPDKRKGMVFLHQSDDGLMHFSWKDRTKGILEDDLIIFPDDCEFRLVPQCKTGRVYLLKFKSSAKKFFFWMQEPKAEKDEDICQKVNDLLNNPPTPGSSGSGGGGSGGSRGMGIPAELAGGLGAGDLQNLLGNMSQQELMQLLGSMGMGGLGGLSNLMGGGRPSSAQSDSAPPSRVQSSPGGRASTVGDQPQRPVTAAALPSQGGTGSTSSRPATTTGTTGSTGSSAGTATTTTSTTPSTSTTSTTAAGIQLSTLQNILSGMGGEAEQGGESIDLATAVSPEAMIPILANAEIQERLMPFLPEGEQLPKTEEELRLTVSSPQFQQAMSSFSAALVSGQLGPLMGQFNLGEDVANSAAQGDIDAFAKALQEAMSKKNAEKSDKDEKKE